MRPKALYGLLQPREVKQLLLSSSMTDTQQAAVMTPRAGDVQLIASSFTEVTVENQTDRIAAYVVVVVPKVAVKLATVPWGAVVRDVGMALDDSGILERVKQLFGAVQALRSRPR